MTGPLGEVLIAGHPKTAMTPYDYCTWTFSQEHLNHIVHMASKKLEGRNESRKTGGEIFRYFRFLLLMTRVDFLSRRSLQSCVPVSENFPNLNPGTTMTRKWIEDLRVCVTLSHASEARVTGSTKRWSLASGFVDANIVTERQTSFYQTLFVLMKVCYADMDLEGTGLFSDYLITWHWTLSPETDARSKVQHLGTSNYI